MKRMQLVAFLLVVILMLACGPLAQVTATPVPPTEALPPATNVPTTTSAAPPSTAAPSATLPATPTFTVATATSVPANTAAPSATALGATSAPLPTGSPSNFVDDRSTAASVMQSFVSALNLHQYVRAYSYWNPDSPQLQPFPAFEAGYEGTQSIQLTVGGVTSDAGAGQLYYSAPVTLVATTTGGQTQTFVGCYVLHLSQPAIQGEPPFRPLAIDSAVVEQVANNANTAGLMAQACADNPGSPVPATPVPAPNDISAARYLDDRSDAMQVVRSLFNAVNRHEYVRAYTYWEASAVGLPSFEDFQEGYETTESVQLTVGEVSGDAGAGQFYYSVPVTLVSTTTANATQTFVGCYVVHQSSPDAQGQPPFQPMGIREANVQSVANNADTAALMAQACG